MTQITEETVVRASPRHVSADLVDSTVVLQLTDGLYYELNPVGAHLWKLLQAEPRTVEELVEAIVADFEVEPERCRQDVFDHVGELLGFRLVTTEDPGAEESPDDG